MNSDRRVDIVSFQVDDWDMQWHSRHHLCWEFAKSNRVLFVAPPYYIVDLLERKRKTKFRGLRRVGRGLVVYTPPRWLPYSFRYKRADALVGDLRRRLLKRAVRRCALVKPVLYIWHPAFINVIDEFPDSFVVFHKYDHYAGYRGGSGSPDADEIRLLRRANLVITASEGLRRLSSETQADVIHVPHGVDVERFARSREDASGYDDVNAIPRPRIGYVGLINEKVDFALLLHLCRARPDWSVVMIGPVRVLDREHRTALEALQREPNCYFLGFKEFSRIPGYMWSLDVGLMCYHINTWTYYGHPLKMHEYLACGLPVVSSDLPAVRPFVDVIRIATGYEAWMAAVEASLTDTEAASVRRRRETARQNSWDMRAATIMRAVRERLSDCP